MLWAAAMRNALIVTGVLAVASLLFRFSNEFGSRFIFVAAVPLIAGVGTIGVVAAARARRRAHLVRRLRA